MHFAFVFTLINFDKCRWRYETRQFDDGSRRLLIVAASRCHRRGGGGNVHLLAYGKQSFPVECGKIASLSIGNAHRTAWFPSGRVLLLPSIYDAVLLFNWRDNNVVSPRSFFTLNTLARLERRMPVAVSIGGVDCMRRIATVVGCILYRLHASVVATTLAVSGSITVPTRSYTRPIGSYKWFGARHAILNVTEAKWHYEVALRSSVRL